MRRYLVYFLTCFVLAVFAGIPVTSFAVTAPGIGFKKQKKEKPVRVEDKEAPTVLQAEQISGRRSRDLYLDYEAEIERDQTLMTGDHGILHQEENEAEAIGDAFIQRFGDQFTADKANINLDTGAGTMSRATYKLEINNGQGSASRIDLIDDDNTEIFKGTYSTCEGADPDWYLEMKHAHIDEPLNTTDAKSPVLYFMDLPILAAPMASFPVKDQRKSGFLAPTFSISSKEGLELSVPYYFNLAPNYDFTLTPNLVTKRGLQVTAEARYLGNNYEGLHYIEVLPSDREADRNRMFLSSQHKHSFGDGWNFNWMFYTASDDEYPDDFSISRRMGGDTDRDNVDRLMPQMVSISKSFSSETIGNWNASLMASNFKVLQDDEAPIIKPFSRLPQFTIRGSDDNVAGFDWSLMANYTRFWLSDEWLDQKPLQEQARGDRFLMNAQVSYPFMGSSYFLTPKVIINMAKYDLDKSPYDEKKLTRVLPTFSLDGGLIFERDTSLFGEGSKQTLEPRLFYVYTPYKDQSKYPIFDSGEPSFGYTTLFTENRFAGNDRIADANNLTAAVTTRFIEDNGTERAQLTLGQRFYIRDQRVYLYNSTTNESNNRSDLLALANGQITDEFFVDSSIEYNASTKKTYMGNAGLQWKPGPKKVINAEYRYLRDASSYYSRYSASELARLISTYKDWDYADYLYESEIDQVHVSGQWPLMDKWYLVGMLSYALPEKKSIENLLGVEYNADCWVFRLMTNHYITSSTEGNTALYFQLELKGLSKLGSNPTETLEKTVPGYEPLTPQKK